MNKAHSTAAPTGGATFLAGLMLGAVAALLVTPKTGQENREMLKEKIDKAKVKIDEKVGQMKRKKENMASTMEEDADLDE